MKLKSKVFVVAFHEAVRYVERRDSYAIYKEKETENKTHVKDFCNHTFTKVVARRASAHFSENGLTVICFTTGATLRADRRRLIETKWIFN